MALIVQKYGGTSVKDPECLKRVASRMIKEYDAGNDIIAVVSAQGDTTDRLIDKANQITKSPSARDLDFLVTAGEQMSAALLCMEIREQKRKAVPLTGWQAGFLTSSTHGKARVRRIRRDRLLSELDKGNIIVVTGFQGYNRYDDITTLGRGGSDTSAVAIAARLGADKCQIFTDVNGIYTTDPRIVPEAKKLDEISYDEMLELASLGANVLNGRAVEMAKKYNVPLEILSSIEDEPGTMVKEVTNVEKMLITGVTKDDNIARITVTRLSDKPGVAFRLFSLLGKEGINVDIILQSLGRDGKKDITFTVDGDEGERALEIIETHKELIGCEEVLLDNTVSKVSVVGAGMESNAGMAGKVFEALGDAHINIHMISTSEIKISVLIDKELSEAAVRAIHRDVIEPVMR